MKRKHRKPTPGPNRRTPAYDPQVATREYARQRTARVCDRYRAALERNLTTARTDGDTDVQVNNYSRAYARLRGIEQQVRDVLCAHGVALMLFVPYLNFARRLDRLSRTFEGETLCIEAAVAVARWACKGLSQAVLEDIRSRVFAIDPPTGP